MDTQAVTPQCHNPPRPSAAPTALHMTSLSFRPGPPSSMPHVTWSQSSFVRQEGALHGFAVPESKQTPLRSGRRERQQVLIYSWRQNFSLISGLGPTSHPETSLGSSSACHPDPTLALSLRKAICSDTLHSVNTWQLDLRSPFLKKTHLA